MKSHIWKNIIHIISICAFVYDTWIIIDESIYVYMYDLSVCIYKYMGVFIYRVQIDM